MSGLHRVDPYRLFFPLGLVYAVVGAALWAVASVSGHGYPAELHRTLMIEGFELAFIAGFLLTALPGLLHGRKVGGGEMSLVFTALLLFGACAFAGVLAAAHACALLAILSIVAIAARRLPSASAPPPEEFVHVALGLLFGIVGVTLLLAESLGMPRLGPPRFAAHLLSLGMVLTLVLGVGALIVPVFAGIQDPLVIAGLARAHERPPRRWFHAVVALLLVLAFVLEAAGAGAWGARSRAAAATPMLLLAWKLPRGPGRGDRSAWSMWGSGVFLLIGLWVAASAPHWAMLGHHIVFIGGFGLLTLAVGTRVVIAHGRHGMPAEPRVLSAAVVALLLFALITRSVAELLPRGAMHAYALAALGWVAACLVWFARAWPRIRRTA